MKLRPEYSFNEDGTLNEFWLWADGDADTPDKPKCLLHLEHMGGKSWYQGIYLPSADGPEHTRDIQMWVGRGGLFVADYEDGECKEYMQPGVDDDVEDVEDDGADDENEEEA